MDEVQNAGGTALFSEQAMFSLDTPEGKMLATILAAFAAFEADLISARTKAGLQVVKHNGSRSGRPIGNPHFRPVPGPVIALIQQLRDEGLSFRRIALEPNAHQVPTAQGGAAWYAQTVAGVVKRADAA